MKRLFLDIETLPAPEATADLVRGQFKKNPDRSATFEEFLRRTSLNPNFGQIFCIGYAFDDKPAVLLQGQEAKQLQKFWQLAADVDLFIGHSILEFDLPFIIKRSMVHRVKPTRTLSFARYHAEPIYDTKKEWDSWANVPATSLDMLAKILGYESSKQGIDGSQVYDFWLSGRHQEIYDYCKRDVELTRKIYRRLNFLPEAE